MCRSILNAKICIADKAILLHLLFLFGFYFNAVAQSYPKIDELLMQLKSTSDTSVIIDIQFKIGKLYSDNSDFIKAAEFYFNALRIAEKIQDELLQATALNKISTTYIETEEFEQAKSYAQKAIHLFSKHKNNQGLGDAYNSLGNIYYLTAQDSIAIEQYKTSINHRTLANDSTGLFATLKNLGALYYAIKDTAKAIYYIENSVNYLNSKSDSLRWFSAFMTLGELYVYSGYLEKGKQNLDKAKQYISSVKGFHKLKDYHHALYRYYYTKKKYEEAFEQYAKYEAFRDSVNNLQKSRQLFELNTRYETEKKEAEIFRQKQLLEQEKRNRKLYLAIFSTLMLLLVSLLIIYRQRQQRKTEQLLQQQSEKSLQEIYNAEQKERIRIARDLHDSIGQKLAVMRMILPKAEGNKELEKISIYLDETAAEVRSISHNLIPEILNLGLVKAVENLADRINSTENIKVEFIADNEVQKLTLPKQTELSLYRIIQEILSNIVRHSKTEILKIELRGNSDFVQILIEDNGVGFDTNAIDESKGLGWKNIFARIKLVNGNIKIQSEKNKGSQFLINIPVA